MQCTCHIIWIYIFKIASAKSPAVKQNKHKICEIKGSGAYYQFFFSEDTNTSISSWALGVPEMDLIGIYVFAF